MTDEYTYEFTGLEHEIRDAIVASNKRGDQLFEAQRDVLNVIQNVRSDIRPAIQDAQSAVEKLETTDGDHRREAKTASRMIFRLVGELMNIDAHSRYISKMIAVGDNIQSCRQRSLNHVDLEAAMESLEEQKSYYYSEVPSSFRTTIDKAQEFLNDPAATFNDGGGAIEIMDGEIDIDTEVPFDTEITCIVESSSGNQYPMFQASGFSICTCPAKKFQSSPVCKHEIAKMFS